MIASILNYNITHDIVHSQDLSGKDIFLQNRCANCHTIGRGRFVGPDLYNVDQRYSKEDIVKWMVNSQQIYSSTGKMPMNEGYPPMPPMNIDTDSAVKIYEYLKDFKLDADSPLAGRIEGAVSNETLKTTIQDVEVKLTSFLGDIEKEKYVADTNKQGGYSFNGLRWDRAYVISLMYKDVEYATGKFVFEPNESVKIFDLPVYDTTTDDSLIMLDSSHIIIQIENDRASVAELSVVKNGGEAVYIGNSNDSGKAETLKFSIPENAEAVQFHHGIGQETSIIKDGYLASTLSVQPGITRIVYSYELPINNNITLEKKIDYMTNSQLVLVSDNGYDVKVEGLGNSELVEMNNQKFLKWNGNDLNKGQALKITINKPFFTGDYSKLTLVVVVVLVIIAGIAYSSYFKKISQPATYQTDQEKTRKELIKEIAELDDMFEAGKIEESAYRKLREVKKTKLVGMTKKNR